MLVTRMLRDSRIAARDAAAMPFPREETTPPVTKTYLVIYPRRVGMEEFTCIPRAAQMSFRCDVPEIDRAEGTPLRGDLLRGRLERLDADFLRELRLIARECGGRLHRVMPRMGQVY